MAKTALLPRYNQKRGWIGGDSRTLYLFKAHLTGEEAVFPGGGSGKQLLMHWGPDADVRIATRDEAEVLWQNPLPPGWNVIERVAREEAHASIKGRGKASHATKKYSQKASDKIGRTMHEFKRGQLKSSSGKKVTSRKQALAIGLSQARAKGYKVPERSHSKMLSGELVRVEPVRMPTGATAEIHIHRGNGSYGGVLVLSNGNELPMSLGVPVPTNAEEALRGAKKFLTSVYGKTN